MLSRNCFELIVEMVREFLEYDFIIGLLIWKICCKKVQKGSVVGLVCGNGRKFYVKVRIGCFYCVYCFIWLIVIGEWLKYYIDYVDNDGMNN